MASRAFAASYSLFALLLREPLRGIRLRIAERRRAGHHLGNEPACRRAERQSPMRVPARQPQPVLSWSPPDHRAGIGKARTRAEPGPRLGLLAERKQFARGRQ